MTKKTGLLLVNLGSPDAPTAKAVRKYLFEFLHDHRVIELTRWIWCFILHGIILRVRPKKSAAAYAKIWGPQGAEAPLIRITRAQAAGIQAGLGEGVHVEVAMRYGNPSIEAGIAALEAKGCTRIAVFPLYPQYAAATTASIYDAVGKAIKKRRYAPQIRYLGDYHDHPGYIKAITGSLRAHIAGLDYTPDRILASFHGLPQECVDKGDPYQAQCIAGAELMRADMGMDDTQFMTTFQSRFGPKAWLQPYTDKTLEAMPEQGHKKVVVITPGFTADCLETLEEMALEAGEIFEEHGGTHYSVVPCLNDSPEHIELLTQIAREELLAGWIESKPD